MGLTRDQSKGFSPLPGDSPCTLPGRFWVLSTGPASGCDSASPTGLLCLPGHQTGWGPGPRFPSLLSQLGAHGFRREAESVGEAANLELGLCQRGCWPLGSRTVSRERGGQVGRLHHGNGRWPCTGSRIAACFEAAACGNLCVQQDLA